MGNFYKENIKKSIIGIIIGVGILVFFNKKYEELPMGIQNSFKNMNIEQRVEFTKVLEHYGQKKDTLKLKAAYSLITNLPLYSYRKMPTAYNELFDSLLTYKSLLNKDPKNTSNYCIEKVRDSFVNGIKYFSENYLLYNRKFIKDVDTISSNDLIENIDFAFKAHNKLPESLKSNFNDFCKFVLPYRNGKEPFESGKRKELFIKYSWVYDSINTMPIKDIVAKIYNDLKVKVDFDRLQKYNLNLSPSQFEVIQSGLCRDVTNYFVFLFRSLGIAAGSDYLLHWGNTHHSLGHDWFFIKINNEFLPVQAEYKGLDFTKVDDRFDLSSIPKIYRTNFERINYKNLKIIPDEDVTSEYILTSTISIKNKHELDYSGEFKLCVFDKKNNWAIVDENFIEINKQVTFRNVGRGVLYIVTTEDINQPINSPFYLDFKGNTIFFDNKSKEVDLVKLLRKYPPINPAVNQKIKRLKSLNFCKVLGSNSTDQESFKEIYKIKNFSSSHDLLFIFDKLKYYRYYQLLGDKNKLIHLAGLTLVNENEKLINTTKVIVNNRRNFRTSKNLEGRIIDFNPLTSVSLKNLNIIFEVPKKTKVSGFKIQARNDDNHINIGEEYELMVFDKSWKSIRKEVAQDTVLRYEGLTIDGLYVLHNLTKGNEECVFTIDNNGNQFWFGISDIKELKKDFEY
ncbi:transglutaminase-like domain-containing protein [Flavicella sediminum]|uniref:transglutaminase-like domain-containing protein n=1 Tax=Flavicella sediminum TaxID=2585141 RepID=UPI00111F0C54|nr:transglutaminase-like domain-containing protein [Flavicella sediminum]